MRLTMLIAFAASGLALTAARADSPLIPVAIDSLTGYVVPEADARKCSADLLANIPGLAKIDGFWTPPEQDILVANRAFRDMIHAAVKDPTTLFPDLAPNPDPTAPVDAGAAQQLEHERSELVLISANYDSYARQYVGVIIDGQKLVFCNYSSGTNIDPSTRYIFVQKVFDPAAGIRFLQCRFDPEEKTCSNFTRIGTWQTPNK